MNETSVGRRTFLVGGLAVAVAATLEACGDDSSTPATTPASSGSTVAPSSTTGTTTGSTVPATTSEAATTVATPAIPAADTVKALAAAVEGVPELSLVSLGFATTSAAGIMTLRGDGPVTVFAPSNDAVAAALVRLDGLGLQPIAIPAAIALVNYSVIDGARTAADLTAAAGTDITTRHGATLAITAGADGLAVNGVKVVRSDLDAGGNIIHIVGEMLLPPDITGQPVPPTSAPGSSLADLIASKPELSMFVDSAKCFGVWDVIVAANGFTVFVPTNDAFAALGAELDTAHVALATTADANNLLMTHVLAGTVTAANLATQTSLSMLNGATVPVSAAGGAVKVGTAALVTSDLSANNGLLHIIDQVLLPA